jgi:glutamine synthetase
MERMSPPDPSTLRDSLRRATHARFFITDIDGVCRGKHLSGDRMAELLDHGGTIASAVFGWDIADDLYTADVDFAGLHSALGEVGLRLDPATARRLPWDDDRWVLIGEHLTPDGSPLPQCPRQVLQRVLDQARERGYTAQVGVEYEWYVLDETERSVRDKGYRGLSTATQSITNYSPFRIDAQKAFVDDLFRWLPAVDIPIEALHTEAGPGNLEVAIRYGEALSSADRAALFKQSVREIGRRHGLLSTFMAKWSPAYGGCGQHLHQSLWQNGANAFHAPEQPHGISDTLRHYIAGQLHALPDLMALYAPFVNSYKRLVDGMLAPVLANWGVDDRHVALRVVPGSARSLRLETRVPGADANPYLIIAASVAAGLYGIAHRLEPGAARVPGVAGDRRLPRTLAEATQRMAESALARELLGEAFVEHFVQTRRWELRRFESAVTDWELARYLELV